MGDKGGSLHGEYDREEGISVKGILSDLMSAPRPGSQSVGQDPTGVTEQIPCMSDVIHNSKIIVME